jgi:OmcA/MtrC family decaheme c-type cytochrome
MDLATDERWKNGARLGIQVGWSTDEYTNEGLGTSPAPAQPLFFNALGSGVTAVDDGNYRAVIDITDLGFDTLTVALEGHPQTPSLPIGDWVAVPVRDVFKDVNIEKRGTVEPRRRVIDPEKCNDCHDSAGAGLTLHGGNRSTDMQVCVLCHNPDATDIRQRPDDPNSTPDGKAEETIDMKRMIHGIHAGASLQEGLVIYGFGSSIHDYSNVRFVGNLANCLTCHEPNTYSTDDAWQTLASTVHTGDVTTPLDDLNISQVTAVCSSCHDQDRAVTHMLMNGGSFGALDADIATASFVPEPGRVVLSLASLVTLAALVHHTRRESRRRMIRSGIAG